MSNQEEPQGEKIDLNIFDDLDGMRDIKPLTQGLGFKDRVSEGVYTIEQGVEDYSSDSGTLDIGRENMGDGVLNIHNEVELNLETPEITQPILFHSGHDGLIKRSAKKSGESFFGAVIDVLLVFAISILTIAFLTEFTKYKFNFDALLSAQYRELLKAGVVFGAYFLSYKIFTRVFFGKSLGEWSSRHQLGLLLQQHKPMYPFQVAVREFVSLVTGVFLFPLVSALTRRDLGYYVSGLQTYVEQKK